jgi:hypothetical protein
MSVATVSRGISLVFALALAQVQGGFPLFEQGAFAAVVNIHIDQACASASLGRARK